MFRSYQMVISKIEWLNLLTRSRDSDNDWDGVDNRRCLDQRLLDEDQLLIQIALVLASYDVLLGYHWAIYMNCL